MFLLIRRRRWRRNSRERIYIPLCFYLYVIVEYGTNDVWKFTFHYVSTYTAQAHHYILAIDTFTFHYVSTYTDCTENIPCSILHLHSTMFLLILTSTGTIHSLLIIFTFHYVSTYTLPFDCPPNEATIFTFHYVSTYTPQPVSSRHSCA